MNSQKKVRKLEDRTTEIIEAEEQKEKRFKKSEQSLRFLWHAIKWTNVCTVRVLEGNTENGAERIFQEILAEKFPYLIKSIDTNIQEAH